MNHLFSRIRERARGLTLLDLAGEAAARVRRMAINTRQRLADEPQQTYISDEELDRATSDDGRGWPAALLPGLADAGRTAEAVKRLFPTSAGETIQEAEAIRSHRFALFETSFDFGDRIDWHSDPHTGASWPLAHFSRVPLVLTGASRWDLAEHPARGPDVRVVWELNRLHHLTTLGRAYALSRDERFVEEFLWQVASWYEQNPPRFGVNWVVAMEAAIRAVNLIAAACLFSDSRLLSDETSRLMLKLLLAHGRHIRRNLERRRGGSSNHYLSNLVGLFAIGLMLPQFRESSEWVRIGVAGLLEEMEAQVLPDGVDYEGSTGYHRLVVEIYALFFTVCRAGDISLPGRSWERLRRMFDFVSHYLKPDGTAPLIGDSDDGRLLRLKTRRAVDHSYLMSIANVLFEGDGFTPAGGIDEEAIWWFGVPAIEAFNRAAPATIPESRGYPEAQIFVQRAQSGETGPEQQLYAIIDCGDNGARGHGSHAHCDAMSLELYACGQTFLRDPGTFAYTGSERWRNAFRSTAYHNTVRVDGEEISELRPGWLFALGSNVRPRINRWESDSGRDVLDAEHDGYARLPEPVVHRRIVTFDKREGYWTIEDELTGRGEHTFEFCFLFEPGIEVVTGEGGRIAARGRLAELAVIPASAHDLEIEPVSRWVSLSYGKCEPASGVVYRLRQTVPVKSTMLLIPFLKADSEKVNRIMGMLMV